MYRTQTSLENAENLIDLDDLNEFLDFFFQFYDSNSNNLQTSKEAFNSFRTYNDQAYTNICLLNELDELNQKNFIYVLIDVFLYIDLYYLHTDLSQKQTRAFFQYFKILMKKDFKINGELISINDLYDLLNMEIKIKFSKKLKKYQKDSSEETLVESLEPEIAPRSVSQVLDPSRFQQVQNFSFIQPSMNYKQEYPKFFYSHSKLNYYPGFQSNPYSYNSLNNLNSYYNSLYNLFSMVK